MSWLKSVIWLSAALIAISAGCNYTEGQCYPRGQGDQNGGVGGGVIVPNGVGGFGDVPPDPQEASDPPPPDCNIATQSPCNEKCQKEYETAAGECTKYKDSTQRELCNDAAYLAYKSCREKCQQQANTDCDDKYQDCVDNGPGSCLDVEAGKTLCQRCWERCNAGDSPSARCRKCKF